MSRKLLLNSLLTDEASERLYLEHAGFHMAIDGLVGMLPSLVAGMASQALEDESRRVGAVQELRDRPADITWWMEGTPTPTPVEMPFEEPEAIPAPVKRARKRAPAKPVRKSQPPAKKKSTRRR